MRESHCRAFSVADAMILVAAMAVGFGVNRVTGWGFPLGLPNARTRGLAYSMVVGQYHLAILPWLVVGSLAFLAIRLRQPRPALRRCFREPGMVASGAAAMGILVNALWMLVVMFTFNGMTLDLILARRDEAKIYGDRIGFAVIGAWLTLVMVRGWVPIPCWIDRIGRVLGILWIALIGLRLFEYIVFAYF